MSSCQEGFVPPVNPFDKLSELAELAAAHDGGAVDLSIGTPCDPPAPAVVEALASSGTERGYPPSAGTPALREAAAAWLQRRLGVSVPPSQIAPCVGSKEFVAGVPHWLHLRKPSADTVLYPGLAYPTYEMGADLARCRAVAVAVNAEGRLDLASVAAEDAERALCLWVNSPGNPAGQLEDLAAAAEWGRARGVPVLSDECYVEFTWSDRGRTILEHGLSGVLAVHSLSKRSNLAGLRVGYFAGDPELVAYLAGVRQHAGFIVPGPVQHAAAVALADDAHVDAQRAVYLERLETLAQWLADAGLPVSLPGGGFYLWVRAPANVAGARAGESAGFALARWMAARAGVIGSPGEAYGLAGADYLRLAVVQPMERLKLVATRLAASGGASPWH
ncbi:MAG: aminotransferase class I/II-fold pyridoxal phosphate-dependent enzyme [Acidimicrobiales bacterium]